MWGFGSMQRWDVPYVGALPALLGRQAAVAGLKCYEFTVPFRWSQTWVQFICVALMIFWFLLQYFYLKFLSSFCTHCQKRTAVCSQQIFFVSTMTLQKSGLIIQIIMILSFEHVFYCCLHLCLYFQMKCILKREIFKKFHVAVQMLHQAQVVGIWGSFLKEQDILSGFRQCRDNAFYFGILQTYKLAVSLKYL